MRMLLKAQMSTDRTNEAIRSGRLSSAVEATMQELHPEAAYFTVEDGKRTMLLVFDMERSSLMPPAAERLFMDMGASIDFTPVMNPDELREGLSSLNREAMATG